MNKDLNLIKDIYNIRYLDKSLNSIKKQGWGSKKSQNLRFEILSQIGLLNNKTILDIGCGMGDFLVFLKKKKILNYTGIDISELFINHCIKKFKSKKINFICNDFLTYKFNTKFDYIFLSGALNLKLENNKNIIIAEKFIRKAYSLCKIGCSFNFLSSNVDYTNKKDFHYNSSELVKICNKLTRKYSLDHNYKLYEFTINLYK